MSCYGKQALTTLGKFRPLKENVVLRRFDSET